MAGALVKDSKKQTGKISMSVDWLSESNEILLNPSLPASERQSIEKAVKKTDLKKHVFIATSGSTGNRKIVCLSKEALLCSAENVNSWVNASKADIWFQALPLFHVGGLGVEARAYLTKSKVIKLQFSNYKWNAKEFCQQIDEHKCTLGSLVPTQVYDLVKASLSAPESLRAVFVGGGRLEPSLYKKSRELGWPLLPTYGFSEAGSQVATAEMKSLESFSLNEEEMPKAKLLPHIQFRDENGKVEFKAESLLSGYLIQNDKKWSFVDPKNDGWFECQDRLFIDENRYVEFLGRSDSLVKVNGENVDVERLNQIWQGIEEDADSLIVAIPCERAGSEIILVSDKDVNNSALEEFNQKVLPFEKLSRVVVLDEIPRTSLGKVDMGVLLERIDFDQ